MRYGKSSIPAVAFVLICYVSAQAAPCLCSQLDIVEAELRNAEKLEKAFSEHIVELRPKGAQESVVALNKFAAGPAREGLERVPAGAGRFPEFRYWPNGMDVGVGRLDGHTNDWLCEMSDSNKKELDGLVAASACDGIGDAVRAHENVHVEMCRAIGFRAYLSMHGADRSREEAEAYGVQIVALAGLITNLRSEEAGDCVESIVRCHPKGGWPTTFCTDVHYRTLDECAAQCPCYPKICVNEGKKRRR